METPMNASNPLVRGAALALAIVMLTFTVIQAQGCQDAPPPKATPKTPTKKAEDTKPAAAKKAEAKFKKTGQLTTATAASTTDKNSIMFKAPYYTEKDRGLIKEYDNKFNIASWDGWLNYNALSSAKKLRGKVLFVGSDAMALPQGAKAYEKLANGKIEKIWLDKVTQFDFYDKKEAVTTATDSVAKHFAQQTK